MLNLKKIKKDYQTASETVHALKGVSIAFRKSEFVSILGPSGCGKTTLLNIVGGLDKYTDGELVINGRSTKSYTDRDWDVYRNHRIGFIFQSYNLIPHQTVLMNVELALTIAGVSKEERVARAKQALDRVGLKGQYNKRPNQLSGGQCQRVAIARALVNNPEILLADEPTGALDTVTSVQIMELIKEISKERLVIMVTHNPELAEEYSSRIVRLIDGEITEDSNPFSDEEEADECALLAAKIAEEELYTANTSSVSAENGTEAVTKGKKSATKPKKKEKAKMSFFTAFMLSLKNLFTKKGRTTLTAFAGSIGIIGIALILAVSEGMTAYIDHVQETALASYPITIENQTTDASVLIETFLSQGGDREHSKDQVYKNPLISELVNAMQDVQTSKNDLESFKKFLDEELQKEDSELRDAVTAIQYTYDLNLPIYTKNPDGDIIKSDTSELLTKMFAKFLLGMASGGANFGGEGLGSVNTDTMGSNMMGSMMGINMWQELITDKPDENGNCDPINPLLKEQYDLIYGSWPENYDEIILVVDQNNELDDLTLYALGLISESELDAIIESAVNKTPLPESAKSSWTYEELVYNKETKTGLTFKTVLPGDLYVLTEDGTYKDMSKTFKMNEIYGEALELKVTGIIRQSEEAETAMLTGNIGYTAGLTKYVIEQAITSDVVIAQLENPDIDVLTGLPFRETTGTVSDYEKRGAFLSYVEHLTPAEKKELSIKIQCLKAEISGLEANKEMAKAVVLEMLTPKEGEEPDPEKLMQTLLKFMESSNIELDLDGVDMSTIQDYLLNLDPETELLPLLDPYIEESCKQQIEAGVRQNLSSFKDEQIIGMLDTELADTVPDSQFAIYYDRLTVFSDSTYEDNLVKIGCLDIDSPHSINIFASSFENKDVIAAVINDYNKTVDDTQRISYTDLVGLLMSSITTIIDAITYVLIAFVAISLVVSSIMIGVITLISVQERTKEIGILRAIGASKKNVSAMFNAETIIIGLAAGLLGIGVSYLLCLPINLILNALTGLPNLKAILPIGGAAILVLISVLLTLVSGLIPSRSAAKKDPVVALRTE